MTGDFIPFSNAHNASNFTQYAICFPSDVSIIEFSVAVAVCIALISAEFASTECLFGEINWRNSSRVHPEIMDKILPYISYGSG